MRSSDHTGIVADGGSRVFEGSADRIRARFTRRSAKLLQRAGLFGRLYIRFRIWNFAQEWAARRAPLEALYSADALSSTQGTKNHATEERLALPEGIRCAMRDGTWPRGRIPPARFRHRLGVTWDVDLELIQSEKAILEDSSDIARLQTLVSFCEDEFFRVHKGSTTSGRSELPWLDVERAVVFGGGADIGDDRWLVLDYRISREGPRILVNTVEQLIPPRFAWVVLADSITDFLALAEKK